MSNGKFTDGGNTATISAHHSYAFLYYTQKYVIKWKIIQGVPGGMWNTSGECSLS